MSRPKKSDHDETAISESNYTLALAFAVIQDGIRAAVRVWGHLEGFTYSPKSGLVFNVENLHDTLTLFLDLVRGSRNFKADLPIYLISITCHKSIEIGGVLRSGYEMIGRSSNQPLIGYWRDPERESYLDAVFARYCKPNGGFCQIESENDHSSSLLRHCQVYSIKIWSS